MLYMTYQYIHNSDRIFYLLWCHNNLLRHNCILHYCSCHHKIHLWPNSIFLYHLKFFIYYSWPLKQFQMVALYWKWKIHSQFLDIWCIFDRQTTFHLEDCPKPMSFFVNPVQVKWNHLKQTKVSCYEKFVFRSGVRFWLF